MKRLLYDLGLVAPGLVAAYVLPLWLPLWAALPLALVVMLAVAAFRDWIRAL